MEPRHLHRASAALVFSIGLPLLGCSVATKQKVMEPALHDTERRHETFEATLRILDEHPKYVHEFYELAQKHPKTLDRFITDTAAHLKEERLARVTAENLASNPPSLRQVMIATLDASSSKPDAQRAIAEAIGERPEAAAAAMATRPEAVGASTRALIKEVGKKPDLRPPFLAAMRDNREFFAELLANNPKTAKALAGSTVKAEAQKIFGSEQKPKESRDDKHEDRDGD